MIRCGGVALLGGAMLLGALAFGASSLYLPSVALLVLACGTAMWVTLAAAGAGVSRSPGPPTVEEETPWPVRLEVERGILRPPGGELVEPLLERPIPLRRVQRRARVEVRFARRGPHEIEPAQLAIRDPLGLATRQLSSASLEVLVLPRIEPVAAPRAGRGASTATVGRAAVDSAELEPDALRPYRPGAPATRIHWPAVARTGDVYERSLSSDAGSRPLVVLDTRAAAGEAELDAAVRAAGSLCVHLARRGGCGIMLPGDRRATDVEPDLRGWHPVHVRLALVEAGGLPSAGRLERAGAIFWVTASTAMPAGLVRAAARERWLVAPAAGRGVPAASTEFVVAACAGRRLGRRHVGRRAA